MSPKIPSGGGKFSIPGTSKVPSSPEAGEESAAPSAVDNAKQVAGDAGKELLKGNVAGAKAKAATGATKAAVKSNSTIQEKAQTVEKVAENAQKVVKTGQNASKAVSAIGSNALNIAIAVVLLLVICGIYSVTQIFGKNQSACVSSGDSGSLNIEGSKDMMKNANAIGTWLMKTNFKGNGNKPFSKEQMAGIIGNIYTESTIQPATTQNHQNDKISNQELIAMGPGRGGFAVGVFQFDASLRYEFAKFAQSKNKPWQDLGTQLQFAQKWLDGEVPGSPQVKNAVGKFASAEPKTPSGYAFAWNDNLEHSGSAGSRTDPAAVSRAKFAESFIGKFQPTADIPSTGGDGGGGGCDSGGGSFDASGIVKLAESIAWPRDQADKADSHGDPVGKQYATPGYIAAKAKAEQLGGKDPAGLYASCDRFAATVIKNTVDKNFPWGGTIQQDAYFRAHRDKWQEITSKAALKPGDVLVTHGDGHIVIYLGKYQGIDSMASASHSQHTGVIGDAGYFNDSLHDTSGRPYSGWRFIGH